MINITLPDSSIKSFDNNPTGMDIAKSISEGFARNCVAMELDENLIDLYYEIKNDSAIKFITTKDEQGLEILRHSSAHVMAEAVQNVYKKALLTIGPVIEDGFYYDIDMPPISEDDFQVIETEMKK
ncbi:MAG: TGS domain-containing protein, partial [Desulfobacteraceae bacterium]|nr:TGS domain-containing protein [Desulfobacteraceae bacterium]